MATTTVTQGVTDVNKDATKQAANAKVKIVNADDGTTTVLKNDSCPGQNDEEPPVVSDKAPTVNGDNKPRQASPEREQRELTPGTEFIEFEFSPKKDPSFKRDKSSSLEPEDVLDELYEAASKGDTNKLSNLIFTEHKGGQDVTKDLLQMKDHLSSTESFQSSAILNLLKRKTPIEKEKIANIEPSEKRIRPKKKQVDFTNVKNIRVTTPFGDGVLLDSASYRVVDGVIRRKNPFRTPTPPPPDMTPVFGCQDKSFTSSRSNAPVIEKNLIDYSVLTKALTKTLESKLQEGTDNDVKIVIFCNNKPIQSFSVRSNNKPQETSAVTVNKPIRPKSPPVIISSPPPDKPAASCSANSLLSQVTNSQTFEAVPATPVNDILSRNPYYLSRQLTTAISPPNNIPTIGDVKAILERNKRIASESLARFSSGRSKTRKIGDDQLSLILKELKKKGSDSDSDSNPATTQETNPENSSKDDDLAENNLVINDSMDVTTDENCNEKESLIKCDQCDKSFKQMRYVNRHKIRVHSKAKHQEQQHSITTAASEENAAMVTCEKVSSNFAGSFLIKDGVITPNNDSDEKLLKTEPLEMTESEKGISTKRMSMSLNEMSNKRVKSERDGNMGVNSVKKEEFKVIGLKMDGSSVDDMENTGDEGGDEEENIGDEIDEEIDITTVKSEPVSEADDEQEIESVLAEGNILNFLETADKNKRSLFAKEAAPPGVTAKDILNGGNNTKAYNFDYRPPYTSEGLIEPVYVCEQCGKFYRARKTLKDHFLREHAKDKDDEPLYLYITGNKYQCPICFNNYHSGSELIAHTKKHTGELRSVCRLCGKVYSSVHVLRRHIDNIHSDVKPRPFQCELCDYAASNKWHLKEHYRRHTGEQPYKCPVCEKSFSHQGTMNRHCKTIHRIDLPSQRPFGRHNISDLPDLPMTSETMGSSEMDFNDDSNLQYDSFNQDSNSSQHMETSMNEDSNLECSESELPDSNSGSEEGKDVDLSIVKTEPEEIDVM